MDKLYRARVEVEVLFFADSTKRNLEWDAAHYATRELETVDPTSIDVSEVESIDEIAARERDILCYGSHKYSKRTPAQYFATHTLTTESGA